MKQRFIILSLSISYGGYIFNKAAKRVTGSQNFINNRRQIYQDIWKIILHVSPFDLYINSLTIWSEIIKKRPTTNHKYNEINVFHETKDNELICTGYILTR